MSKVSIWIVARKTLKGAEVKKIVKILPHEHENKPSNATPTQYIKTEDYL